MEEFLMTKQVNHFTTDADILVIRLEGHNDTPFVMLMMEFAEWLIETTGDRTFVRSGDGSRYHSSPSSSISVPIYYYEDEDNQKIYDVEEMSKEFETLIYQLVERK
jgi:hypothetical protein